MRIDEPVTGSAHPFCLVSTRYSCVCKRVSIIGLGRGVREEERTNFAS